MTGEAGEAPIRTREETGIYTYVMPTGETGREINWQEGGRTRWKRLGAVGIRRAREAREEHRVRARGSTTPAAARSTAPLMIDYIREVAASLHDDHRPNTRAKWAALTSDVAADPRLLETAEGRAEAALPGHMSVFAGARVSGDLTDLCAKWLEAMQDPKLVRNRLVRAGPPSEHRWVRQRGAYDKATRRSYFDIMKVVLDTAVDDGFLSINPLGGRRTRRPTPSPPRLRVLATDEQRRLLDAAPARHRILILVALYTGLRINEELALCWENVDLAHLVIRVTHQIDGSRRVPYPKTEAGYREIWLPTALASALATLRVDSPWHRPEDYVFATRNGAPRGDGNVRQDILYPAVRRAALNAGRRHEDRVVFHSLRHTYVSMLISNREISEATIARLAGHSSTLSLRLTYEHLFDQHRDEAEVRRFSGAILDEVLAGRSGAESAPVNTAGAAAPHAADSGEDEGQARAVRQSLTLPRPALADARVDPRRDEA